MNTDNILKLAATIEAEQTGNTIKELEELAMVTKGRMRIVDTQKFAELIINKCMDCSLWVGKMNASTVDPIHTAHAINLRIKKQFGL